VSEAVLSDVQEAHTSEEKVDFKVDELEDEQVHNYAVHV
jgi:hypothetical protein